MYNVHILLHAHPRIVLGLSVYTFVHIQVSMYLTAYPLWKSISEYPGYFAGPRMVLGLSVYSVYYICEYVPLRKSISGYPGYFAVCRLIAYPYGRVS
jgi:hypothetical protein